MVVRVERSHTSLTQPSLFLFVCVLYYTVLTRKINRTRSLSYSYGAPAAVGTHLPGSRRPRHHLLQTDFFIWENIRIP